MDQTLTQDSAEAKPAFVGHSYDNLVPWRTFSDAHCFRILPAPFPWRAVLILNILFILFAAGWIYAGFRLASSAEHTFIIVAGIAIGLLTCSGFTGFVQFRFGREQARGPWLVYDRAADVVEFPREKLQLPATQVRLRLLYIQRVSCDEGSELQLVTDGPASPGHPPRPILLMTSIFNQGGPLATLAKTIQCNTPLQVLLIPMKDRVTPAA